MLTRCAPRLYRVSHGTDFFIYTKIYIYKYIYYISILLTVWRSKLIC